MQGDFFFFVFLFTIIWNLSQMISHRFQEISWLLYYYSQFYVTSMQKVKNEKKKKKRIAPNISHSMLMQYSQAAWYKQVYSGFSKCVDRPSTLNSCELFWFPSTVSTSCQHYFRDDWILLCNTLLGRSSPSPLEVGTQLTPKNIISILPKVRRTECRSEISIGIQSRTNSLDLLKAL